MALPHPESDHLVRFRERYFESLQGETQRGIALITAATLNNLLEALLRKQMDLSVKVVKEVVDPFFKGAGPLGAFSTKIKLVRALGLIEDWVYEDLELVRKNSE